MELRYGTNPHQSPASVAAIDSAHMPVRVLQGDPSYINVLDALAGWQLVSEARSALGRPAATSFKHLSPAGAALAGPIDDVMAELYGVDPTAIGSLTRAYIRARDADPKSSYGDMIAVSEPVDAELVGLLMGLACDGIIAPGYAAGTVARLSEKKRGAFVVFQVDPGYRPPADETRELFGLRFRQPRDSRPLTRDVVSTGVVCGTLTPGAVDDLLLGLIVVRYTQSNSVAYLRDGMTLGIGAGQQSRIDGTRLAGAKVDTWWLRRHPVVRELAADTSTRVQDRVNRAITYLDGEDGATIASDERHGWLQRMDDVSFVSDGAIPFRDNIDHAHRHGVRSIAEPGGSVRSRDVLAACQQHSVALTRTGIRLFRH